MSKAEEPLEPEEIEEAQARAEERFAACPDYRAVLCVLLGAKPGPTREGSRQWLVAGFRDPRDCPIGPPRSRIFGKVMIGDTGG
jgi:hypothetical protein